jgi:hypothetical protein
MSTKKALRQQRAERKKELREEERRSARNLRIGLVLVAILIVGTLVIAATLGGGRESGDRVWSAEHGHWHER